MSQLTKLALENSLKKLLTEKPLNRITISEITNDCGVNRMTFYYHFRVSESVEKGQKGLRTFSSDSNTSTVSPDLNSTM